MIYLRIMRFAASALTVVLWLPSAVAVAGVVGTGGQVHLGPAPPSVVSPNAAEDGVIHLFVEQTDVALPVDVVADMTTYFTGYDPFAGPGTSFGRTLGVIPAGTVVSSYYLH